MAGLPILVKFAKDVLYIANLAELNYIKKDEAHRCIRIGAAAKLEDIYNHVDTPALLKDIIREIGSPGIRHSATLGRQYRQRLTRWRQFSRPLSLMPKLFY